MVVLSKQSAYFRIPGLTEADAGQIKRSLDSIRGVFSVSVNTSTRKVAVDYDSTGTDAERIRAKFEKSGYEAQLIANQDFTM